MKERVAGKVLAVGRECVRKDVDGWERREIGERGVRKGWFQRGGWGGEGEK